LERIRKDVVINITILSSSSAKKHIFTHLTIIILLENKILSLKMIAMFYNHPLSPSLLWTEYYPFDFIVSNIF